MTKVYHRSNSNEWETPQWLFEYLDSQYRFTLDPASTNDNRKVDKNYTKEDDGLSKSWEGEVVFCNPPYGREVQQWIKKAYEESLICDKPIVLLIAARPDTNYWFKYIWGKADGIYFIKNRLRFGGAEHSAPFPSAIIVYNGKKEIAPLNLDEYKE